MAIVDLSIDRSKKLIVSSVNGIKPDDMGDVSFDVPEASSGYEVNVSTPAALAEAVRTLPDLLYGIVSINLLNFSSNLPLIIDVPYVGGSGMINFNGHAKDFISMQINVREGSSVLYQVNNFAADAYKFTTAVSQGVPSLANFALISCRGSSLNLAGEPFITVDKANLVVDGSNNFLGYKVNPSNSVFNILNGGRINCTIPFASFLQPVEGSQLKVMTTDGNGGELRLPEGYPTGKPVYFIDPASSGKNVFVQVGKQLVWPDRDQDQEPPDTIAVNFTNFQDEINKLPRVITKKITVAFIAGTRVGDLNITLPVHFPEIRFDFSAVERVQGTVRIINQDDSLVEIYGLKATKIRCDGRNVAMPSGTFLLTGVPPSGQGFVYSSFSQLEAFGARNVIVNANYRITTPAAPIINATSGATVLVNCDELMQYSSTYVNATNGSRVDFTKAIASFTFVATGGSWISVNGQLKAPKETI